jgi:hypothetical protein
MINLVAGKLKPEHPQLSKNSRNQEKSAMGKAVDFRSLIAVLLRECRIPPVKSCRVRI